MPTLIGGRYEVSGELGRGGMGIVYRAQDRALHRPVAVKMILDPLRAGDQNVARFQREASAAARLHHPHIVSVYEVGVDAGRPFIVMELIEGRSLEHVLRDEEVSPRRAVELVAAIALALQHAHDLGIVHRDVKPENVLIDADGEPHVMDFGLANDVSDTRQITVSGQMVGTPSYMAPEQAGSDQHGQTGPHTDVYGLGAVLYRALCGRPPFRADTMLEIVKMVLLDEPAPPRSVRPSVHPDLETITLKCIEKDPGRRYESAGELSDDLERFLDGECIAARPAGRVERARRWGRRNRLLAAGIAGLAVVAVSVVVAGSAAAVRARQRTRAASIAEARAHAASAVRAFRELRAGEAAITDAGGDDETTALPEDLTARHDAILARGLDALEATALLLRVEPDATLARELRFETAMEVGAAARDAGQWSVAASAFERALQTGVDDGRANEGLAGVATARNAIAASHRETVLTVLDDARSGALADRASGVEDALFTLVALREPQTIGLVGAALDAITAEMLDATREAILEATEPEPDERQAGAETLADLPAAVDRLLAGPGEALGAADAATIDEARGRLERRARRAQVGERAAGPAPFGRIVAEAQARRVGQNDLVVARLCCTALGRLAEARSGEDARSSAALRAAARGPLVRHLFAEADGLRAAAAGIALCRIGERDIVLAARDRHFGDDGPFWRQVGRIAARTIAPIPDPSGDAAPLFRAAAAETAPEERRVVLLERPEDASRPADSEEDPTRWRDWARSLRFQGQLDGALRAYDRAVALDPGDGLLHSERGNVLRQMGRLDESLEAHDRACDLAPGEVGVWMHRCLARQSRGDIRGAFADIEEARRLAPGEPEVWVNRANVRKAMGDIPGSIADDTRAIEIAPRRPIAWRNRGLTKKQSGDLEGAFRDLSQALELDPKYVQAWVNRGSVRRLQGDLDGAIADHSRAIEIDPRCTLAWSNRANARRQKGDLDGAISDHGQALAIEPRYANSWNGLGVAKRQNGDLEGAIADFGRAIEIEPRTAKYRLGRAEARRIAGHIEEAIADYSAAIELVPRDATAWRGRGVSRAASGRTREAIADLERSLELAPQDARAAEAKRLLDELRSR